ncbi:uroporphyrinogen-III C-methyltransferase [Paenactinomyces guangxiensis]|uniref:Uroporphyrinogen-III C-methyltransferase n=1 Tax=Paenactinomyces guangxiensis TaxID=1490290 RepID=A0A7W1WUK6_9BACL|nr:uroporphyrinogen-III C-methyltransferase [Paenactinomyces guangxiensis]MBA4496297.1 uroporphyrinogen-III C-methyltransferase [Paenactinomyces guangxiensis]MBH8593350.1 uroporphyrinogen-III C-methyltransferase [Paenactinomyces guangxiensis]
MNGMVYLVGAGPGDPGLITVKGLEAIKKADVIVYDRLASPQLLRYAREDAELIYVGKLPDRHTLKQEEINELLAEKAKEGKVVTRLKGGDPFIFGRGGEEAERCVDEGIPFEVVPGITSAVAVPAYAGIPVTHRDFNSSFAIVTGHERPDKTESSIRWDRLATATETLIFLMGVSNLPFIVEQLVNHGRSKETPVGLVRWGTRVEQETLTGTLENIVQKVQETGFRSPAIIIVGEVVRLREKLSWFENKPLFGKRVLVTRARSQSSALSEKIQALGGEPLEFPVIRITRPERQDLLDASLQQLGKYDWVIFTSVNGVKYFFLRLAELKLDIRLMSKARIAAIGPKTGEALTDKGLLVEVLPEEYKAEALAESLRPLVEAGQEILLPRADIARKVLAKELTQMGCRVTEVDAYDTRIGTEDATEVVKLLEEGAIHVITFTSSSTVRNFVEAIRTVKTEVNPLLKKSRIVCIGPITAQTATELGLQVDAVAESYTIDGLVEAIQQMIAS